MFTDKTPSAYNVDHQITRFFAHNHGLEEKLRKARTYADKQKESPSSLRQTWWALKEGNPDLPTGIVDASLAKVTFSSKRMVKEILPELSQAVAKHPLIKVINNEAHRQNGKLDISFVQTINRDFVLRLRFDATKPYAESSPFLLQNEDSLPEKIKVLTFKR